MMGETRKKYGWTEKGILGFVFLPLGLLFVLLAAVLSQTAPEGSENRIAFLVSFGLTGTVFLLTGAPLLFLDLRRRRRLQRAYEGGNCVTARIAGFTEDRRVSVNGAHPVMAECHYTDPATGTVHIYFSRYLYMHVKDLLKSDEVPLYLDREDPGIGFVDIDAVLPEVVVHR